MAESRTNYFKKYARENRIQTMEASFKDGVAFTRAPLDTGKSRLLVNYDVINEGESLSVRKGMQTKSVYLPYISTDRAPSFITDFRSRVCREVTQSDNQHYRLAIAGQYKATDTHVTGSNLYTAPTEMWVMPIEGTDNGCLVEYDIPCKDMYAFKIDKATSDTSATVKKGYYYVPSVEKVNGLPFPNKTYMGRPVGCFAWDENYYNFNDAGELIRTRYSVATGSTPATFYSEVVEPMPISVKEASSTGFNMLSSTPYVFSDANRSGKIIMDGILPYDGTALIAQPLINKEYKIRCFYQAEANKKYKLVFEYRDTNTESWTKIEEKEMTISNPPSELSVNFACPVEDTMIRVSAYLYSGSAYDATAETILTVGIKYAKAGSAEQANAELKKFDLNKASGMVYWKNYIWVYGIPEAPRTLFRSAINEPRYFPYPNNINIFEEQVLLCIPFNENMLVFTKSQLIQISVSEGNFTKRILQSGLNFTDLDATMVQCIKNMVFFKCGDYYYMVVPKTLSLQNDFALAPVSKNIEYFLDEFGDNITALFKTVYDYGYIEEETFELVNHYNYLSYEDIHNVYVFSTNRGVFINVALLYNTSDRNWRLYTYESQSIYYPLREDATNESELYCPLNMQIDIDGTETTYLGMQYLDTNPLKIADFYIPNGSKITKTDGNWDPDNDIIKESFEDIHFFKNYQLIDSGYRNSDVDYNKRYRELQLKFNNTGGANIRFSMEFILDGDTRIDKYRYTTEHIVDPSSPKYGLIYISRTPVENMEIPGVVALGINENDVNAWVLDNSRFPEIAFWKARLKVSGKGYTPRFRLLSKSEERYEVLGYTWVYRLMYSR